MLTNTNPPSADGNFSDEHGNTQKVAITGDHNKNMGYTDKRDKITNSYSTSHPNEKEINCLFIC
jgi:hypothetical protein